MKKTFLYESKKNCCACNACAQKCPRQAITMTIDQAGYQYPTIDPSRCISCNLCKKVCNYQNGTIETSQKITFVSQAANVDLTQSASGGVFASIAKEVLKDGGIVFGAEMVQDSHVVRHTYITNENELSRLLGSKYVQSDINYSYAKAEEFLKSQKIVLFSGTPCQISGLYGYLQTDYTNLYTIDLVCHGVPNQKLFSDYICNEEKKKKAKIKNYVFRDKSAGWQLMGKMSLQKKNGEKKEVVFAPEKSSYYQMFLNRITYRENCYSCPYAGPNRPGNITIGDFWCVELVHPEILIDNERILDYRKGTSCLIINNDKGSQFFSRYGHKINTWKSDYEKASRYNYQLIRPSAIPKERNRFLQIYSKRGYANVERWFVFTQLPVRVNRKIRLLVPRRVKDMIKKMI